MNKHTLILFIFIFIFIISNSVSSFSSNDLIGVAPQDEVYYKELWSSGGSVKCRDGSKSFTKARLNDDFCDCFDGTDEPGTSACPTGKFYCRNAGHSPRIVFSSRINDGICDCCDGSDEYDGKTNCKNTCWEAGKVARDAFKEKIATYQQGVAIRKHEIEEAKISAAKDEAELSKLKSEEKVLKGIVEQLKEHKEQIEKALEKERIQKEKEEKQKKEAEESKLKERNGEDKVDEPVKSDDDKAEILDNSPAGQDLKQHAESALEVVHNGHGSLDNGEEHSVKEEDTSEVAHVSDPDTGLGSKGEEANQKDDAGMSTADFQFLHTTYGTLMRQRTWPEKEFYSLYGQCFESKQNKYVYKVCPFKQATQEEGYSTTRLGNWKNFEESYNVMLFSNGDNCWNGPDRSLKVRLRCGLKVEVADVNEPSRCEYAATLTTPALCLEGKLKELKDELEVLDKQQPQIHDEL
ncbi:glucosidase 2 subunit beta [Tanacetum coccineum]|uniref:Glucosidase 2 subunit beta n=1 Tax=Tanacetum coccineum TaxID=301880 RepID=A0ABQ5ATF0_9ASTR